jgi:hypothetical protein
VIAFARSDGSGIVLTEAEARANRAEDQRPAIQDQTRYQGISLFE